MIPNPERDPSGETWLVQMALKTIGYNIVADNWRGPRTEKALAHWRATWELDWRRVKASSFADPADVRAFERCKATGKTDMECFRVGDNGKGAWGQVTAQDHTPLCALPREDWQEAGKAGGAPVIVRYRGVEVHGFLGDTMPRRANIRNGAALDLNPAFSKALGLTPPFLIDGVEWRWG